MLSKTRTSLLSLAVIAVLIFSAVGPTIAYADGGTTSTPDTITDECDSNGEAAETGDNCAPEGEGETAETGDSEPSSGEEGAETTDSGSEAEAPTAEPTAEPTAVPTDGASDPAAPSIETADGGEDPNAAPGADPQPPTEEAVPVAEEAAPAPDANILNEIPDNTTVTVLNAEGQSQPLATQDAADAIATSDPIWCPQFQGPTPNANGCTSSFTSFDALLTFLSANPSYQGVGTIYVQQGAYNGGETTIDFNSYNLSNISNSDLTITGGWNTTDNTVDPANASTFNNIPILIGTSTNPWGGSLTISNISISNTNGTGLTVYSQNDISLSSVNVTNSTNGAGAELNAGGNVSVNDSKFERNKTAGAIIRAVGNVSVSNSSFNNPANARRQITGLDIVSDGSVSLFNVLANENRQAGATINAGGSVTIGSSFFSGTKATTGSGTSTTFLGYGLQVVTPGAIDIDNVTANNNFLWGASLNAGGDIAISNSIFNANTTESPGFIDDTGLFIVGGGNVALNNVQANDNRLFGAMIDAVGNVSINNSTFSNNRGIITTGGTTTFNGHGLQITSLAGIFLNNVTASNNMLFGAQLNAGGQVDIANSVFSNTSTGSASNAVGQGLEIVGVGDVSLVNVVLDNNQASGATIQSGGVAFLNAVTASNNGLDGVNVAATCVNVTGGTYSGNGQYGLNLNSSPLNLFGSPVFATNGAGGIFPSAPASCPVVITDPEPPTDPGTPSDPGTTNQSTSPQVVSLQNGNANIVSGAVIPLTGGASSNEGKVTLNSFLANTRVSNAGTNIGIFTGKYAYIYSSHGMHVVAFQPVSLNSIAMSGS